MSLKISNGHKNQKNINQLLIKDTKCKSGASLVLSIKWFQKFKYHANGALEILKIF